MRVASLTFKYNVLQSEEYFCVRNRLKLTHTQKQTIHPWILLHYYNACTVLSFMMLKWCNMFLLYPTVCLTYVLLLVSFSDQQRGGETFWYSVTVFCSWKKQLGRKENQRNVSSVRGIVFTVYSKCKAGKQLWSGSERVVSTCYWLDCLKIWTELQGSAEKLY